MAELTEFMNEKIKTKKLIINNIHLMNKIFKIKNPYKSSFKNIETETLYKSKYDYIKKVKNKITLMNIEELLKVEELIKDGEINIYE